MPNKQIIVELHINLYMQQRPDPIAIHADVQQSKICREVSKSPYDNNLAGLGDNLKLGVAALIHRDTQHRRQTHR